MKSKLLKLSEIVTTAGTQIRAKINADAVEQYAEAMQDATNKFPAVVVFHDGSEFILADGFHRVMAATRNGFKDIEAEVMRGTKKDALKYALGANSTHGIPRTNADKRRSVELALDEWPKVSDRELAKICAVSHTLVSDIRLQVATVATCHECKDCGKEIDSRAAHFTGQCKDCHTSNPPSRIGGDGKTYKLPTRKGPEPITSAIEEQKQPDPIAYQAAEAKRVLGNLELPQTNRGQEAARSLAIQTEEWMAFTLEELPAIRTQAEVTFRQLSDKIKKLKQEKMK